MAQRRISIILIVGASIGLLWLLFGSTLLQSTIMPTATPAATVPWKGKMIFADRGKLNYLPPEYVQKQIELDWKEDVTNFLLKPYWSLSVDEKAKYSIIGWTWENQRQLKAGDRFLITSGSSSSLEVAGCNEAGDVCAILDMWTDLVDNLYAYPSPQIVESRPHFRDGCPKYQYIVTLQWHDKRWKIQEPPDINCIYRSPILPSVMPTRDDF